MSGQPAPVPDRQPLDENAAAAARAYAASQYSHSGDRTPEPYSWVGQRHVEHGPIWSPGHVRPDVSGSLVGGTEAASFFAVVPCRQTSTTTALASLASRLRRVPCPGR